MNKKEKIINNINELTQENLDNVDKYVEELKNKQKIDFIKNNLNNKDKIYNYIFDALEQNGFDVSERKEGNIPIKNNKGKKTCYIDFLVEYDNYGHPVARFCENIPIIDSRIVPFNKINGQFKKRKSTWLKEGHEKYNIGIKCDDDFELVKDVCRKIK